MRDELLEIVENDEAAATAGNGVPQLHDGIFASERDIERRRDGKENPVERPRLRQVAEVHAARPVAEPGAPVAANEARLARAPRAEHRDEALARVESSRKVAQLEHTADKGVALERKVVPDLAHGTPQVVHADHTICLVAVGWRGEGCGAIRANLADLDRILDALQTIVPMRLDA